MTLMINVLLIGAGQRGRAYTRPLQGLEFVKITGIADPNVTRRQKLKGMCKDTSGITEYDDWKEALEDYSQYQAVMICTLDKMHKEPAVEFANRGLHVLCEKPMATSLDDCQEIYDAIKANNVILAMGHVLRYSPHNLLLKELLDKGVIGDIVNINHTEPVGYYHFAHSYVRGNWRREDETTFSLMAKCCHDVDVLLWLLGSHNIKSVASHGALTHFKKSKKPKQAKDAKYCFGCEYEPECEFSAKKIYYEGDSKGRERQWMNAIVTDTSDEEGIKLALEKGPYGRCVYECDNDVVDNQTVSMQFEEATATLTMIAFSEEVCNRKTAIYGTKGEIYADSREIKVWDFLHETCTTHVPKVVVESGHGGGDDGLANAFAYAVKDVLEGVDVDKAQVDHIRCTPDDILQSHKVVFHAEKARLTKTVVDCV